MSQPVEIPELPSDQAIDRLVSLLGPLGRIAQPKIYGLENLPANGSLLVGNHTIFRFLDLPFMMAEVWKRRRLVIRGLGEHAHYAIPVWRDLLAACGMVRGTRDNVRALMGDRQTILVFPGGAREVNKRRGQQYQLLWKERIGFARLAIEQGYPVVPFAAVGADDMLDVIVDRNTPIYGQLAGLYEKLLGFPTRRSSGGSGRRRSPDSSDSISGSASRSTVLASAAASTTPRPRATFATRSGRPSWWGFSPCVTSATRIRTAASSPGCAATVSSGRGQSSSTTRSGQGGWSTSRSRRPVRGATDRRVPREPSTRRSTERP